MAVTAERMVAVLEARVDKFEKAMKKAQGDATSTFSAITANGDKMEARLSSIGGASARGIDQATRSARALQAQTGNLAAQFNDIGVQLAGGQSPFLIAVQQGAQINQVLGGAGVLGTARMLGTAFASVISPVSLLTIAIIGLGGTAIQYFSSMLAGGDDSAESLKEQAALIQQVADKWGDAVPALKAYSDELQRAADAAKLREATDLLIKDDYAPAREAVAALSVEIATLAQNLQDIGQTEGLSDLQREFGNLQQKVEDQTATAADAERVQAALAAVLSGTQTPAVHALTDAFAGLIDVLSDVGPAASSARRATEAAINSLQQLHKTEEDSLRIANEMRVNNEKFIADSERKNALTTEQLRLENEIARVKADAERAGGALSNSRAREIATGNIAADNRRSSEASTARRGASASQRSADRSAREIEREKEAIVDLISTLEFEQSVLGMSDLDREKSTMLRRAGQHATAEQRAEIERLVTALYDEKAALDLSREAMEQMQALGRDVLSGFVDDIRSGTSAVEALANALAKAGQRLLDMSLDGLFSSGKGGKGGGIFGAIASIFGGARANGGPVSANKAYLVGERGPEIVVPSRSGTVLPNHAITRSSGGQDNSRVFHIDARGSQRGVGEEIRAALEAYDRNLDRTIGVKVAGARGMNRAGFR